jgi:hypothetical protein
MLPDAENLDTIKGVANGASDSQEPGDDHLKREGDHLEPKRDSARSGSDHTEPGRHCEEPNENHGESGQDSAEIIFYEVGRHSTAIDRTGA